MEDEVASVVEVAESALSLAQMAINSYRVLSDQNIELFLESAQVQGQLATLDRQVREEVRTLPPDRLVRWLDANPGIVSSALVFVPAGHRWD